MFIKLFQLLTWLRYWNLSSTETIQIDCITRRLHPHGLRRRRICEIFRRRTGNHRTGTVDGATRPDSQADCIELVQQCFNVDHVQLADDEAVQYQQLVADLQAWRHTQPTTDIRID